SGSLITSVTYVSPSVADGGDGSTSVMTLTYTGTQLQNISVSRNGVTQTLTSYTYDGQGRLWTVKVDLSPENATVDTNYITTTYLYETGSNRLQSITTKGGTSSNVNSSMSFAYVNSDGNYRLKTVTDGEGKI